MRAWQLKVGRSVRHSVDCDFCATPTLLADALRSRLTLFKRLLSVASLVLLFLFAGGFVAVKTASAAALSADVIAVDAQVLVDATGSLDIAAVIQRFDAGQGQRAVAQNIMPLAGRQAVWYRLELPPAVPASPHLLLLPHPGLDAVDLYTNDSPVNNALPWRVQLSGDTRAVGQWPVPNLYPAFKLPELPGARSPAYLRVTNIYPVSVSWVVMDALAFQNHIKRWYFLLGVYTGLVILMFAVSCVQGVTWKEPVQFLFAGFVAVAGLAQLAVTGLAGEYFWPQQAWWNDRSLSTLPIAASVLLLLFFHRLLAERASAFALRGFFVVAALGALALAASLAPDRAPYIRYFAPYYIASLLTCLAAASWYVWREPRVGVWLLGAVLCLFGGALFPILRLLGWVPSTNATQYGAQIGAALQIPLLMVGLFFRSREKRANLARIGALGRTDPLTGLGNHRVLLRQLARVSRSTAGAAVMRIQISNINAIREEYGLDVAQASVVHASALAVSVIVEGDAVARHREGDLVLVFNGPVTRQWLLDTGQRLVALGLAGAPELPPQLTLQFKAAVLMAPFESADPTALLHLLESLINGMARRSGTGLRIAAHTSPARG